MMNARLSRNRRDTDKGFTLMEVLIAIVVLSFALLAMATLSGSIMGYNKFADHKTKATTLARDKIEEFKNGSFASITSSASAETVDTLYTRSWAVTDTLTGAGPTATTVMKTVAVTVSFDWQNTSHSVVLTTIITK